MRDPEYTALQALLNLSQTRTVAEREHWLMLIEAVVHDEGSLVTVRALAELAQSWDGVDYAINSGLDLISRQLEHAAAEHSCDGLSLGNLEESLLKVQTQTKRKKLVLM